MSASPSVSQAVSQCGEGVGVAHHLAEFFQVPRLLPLEYRRGIVFVGGQGIGQGGVTGTSPIVQILRIRAESQQIVAARPLYCLQYPIRIKSSAKDLPQRTSAISMKVCYRAEAYT